MSWSKFRPPEQVHDGEITIVGPDLADMDSSKKYPLGILVEIAGKELEADIEGVIERRIHEYTNYIEGFMHLNQRYDIWVRVSKKAYNRGFTTLKYVGMVLEHLLKNELADHRADADYVLYRCRKNFAGLRRGQTIV